MAIRALSPIALTALTALISLWQSAPSQAVTLDAIWVSPDVTIELASVVTADEDVAADNLLGLVMLESLGTLPGDAEVDAFHLESNGDRLFSMNVTTELPGPVVVGRSDVVRYDGSVYTIEFDAGAAGIEAGSNLDAVSRHGSGDLLVSFDTTLQVGSVVADDEDLVRVEGGGVYSLHFDGSAEGVDRALDLDGAHFVPFGDQLLLTFDGSGSVGGVVFDDEDILELDGSAWALTYDGSALHSEWPAADAQAVPEPGLLSMLSAGAAALGLMGRRRAQSCWRTG